MNTIKEISTKNAPGAVGPYSQALSSGAFVFVSGQLPIDPVTQTMPEDIKEQATISLANVKSILEAAEIGLDKVVKTTIYLHDMKYFADVNNIYASFFSKPFPARSCFAVKNLPRGAKVEIEAIASLM